MSMQSYRSIKEVLHTASVDTSKLKEAYDAIEKENDSPEQSFVKQKSAVNFKFDDQGDESQK